MVLLSGCAGTQASREEALAQLVRESVARESLSPTTTPAIASTPASQPGAVLVREDRVSALGLKPEFLAENEANSGPASYPRESQGLTLAQAVARGVAENLALEGARLEPAIAEQDLARARAAFDWTLGAGLDYARTNRPQSVFELGGVPLGLDRSRTQQLQGSLGLRKPTERGGLLSLTTAPTWLNDQTPGATFRPDPSTGVRTEIRLEQPLLRGAGEDVNLQDVRLAVNAEKSATIALRARVLDLALEIEETYWTLARAEHDVRVLARLIERGEKVRDQLRARAEVDATAAQIADAVARVERRRAELMRAENTVRRLRDRLAVLTGRPGETAEISQSPSDEAVALALEDLVAAAMRDRPEVERAALSIDDAEIRRRAAENLKLPTLNLRIAGAVNSLRGDTGSAYGDQFDTRFVDALVGLTLEYPLGNRAGEARAEASRLERMRSVIELRRVLRDVAREVRDAADGVRTSFALIEQTRTGRIAAAEVLRTLRVEKDQTRGYTVERLDLELNRQEQLAQAEREEFGAIVEYRLSLARLARATGQSLERHGISWEQRAEPGQGGTP
ncbi:MAG: TolC family protein [Planctomycetota bacterium]|nr:TolC family protein [Planctomycetota bacterium]